MYPIRSKNNQLGVTLIELLIAVMLSTVVLLGAGAIYRGVDRSFKQGAVKVVGGREATHLSNVLSRRMRMASNFEIYDVDNRLVELDLGNGLALLDDQGQVTYRFEWDSGNKTLADSTGARVTAMDLNAVQFYVDPVQPKTIHFVYQTVDEQNSHVDIESAVTLRN